MTPDEKYMTRCLELARLGKGHVAPNPMVGSVIVCDDKIIGEGYHQFYGQAHAEVNAIKSVKDPSLLTKSTIYVNLEPCAHFGKTPPCSDLIVEKGIPRIVIGCIDSYSEVAGKGVEKLKNAGREVIVGVLEKESLELNRRFFTFHNKKRPYVILKWAESKDGFVDINRDNGEKGTFWITQPETKQLVHKWRHEEAGILVGFNTVINDDPELTVREFEGNSPTRFYLDKKGIIETSRYKIHNDLASTYAIQSTQVKDILAEIYSKEIQSIIVEGGANTLQKFLDSGLWDEARVITGIGNIEKGLKAPKIDKKPSNSFYFGKDLVTTYFND
ncbi:bifunctional diaminohydroxyphosphoribosylaminopyrimidine deaminase/5-amino-6-(5-phosphoribosylamino)uracil reductase RibD [Paracrocinitomix mangrovi]|uniref:bifunctional diaminohydroxyphosphoribosylaminopyrimidine deaminase/5-amino-6-(5-phosphoribosylamino)uracil reductase RibD n=1 Tax=Paracrocinitomix mangrovi TaxID=2862509 RepID=UPI001C8DA899|nr:bifunctional diaminohydroxyphosphoribosylaminopyrimidine deaminase/5-amino-6-(5-phosphoribosylamino)uracil reductase RibD [Paracrocinitomix mangrovi]UKN01746.1 bifunctional diaminohydroxyphosphoribosylaminopyrimidine deaminase/5-amino-6-(5-phosphoribosylamino)uracil reductase RibD [Paracrocinitomix mangrovi]